MEPDRHQARQFADGVPEAEGFAALVCAAAACTADGLAVQLMAALRGSVRASTFGVLVTTGCTLGPAACRFRALGPLVLVQPSDRAHRPIGPAVRIGPLRGAQDIDALQAWLDGGRMDPELLPAHLVGLNRDIAAATSN